MLNRGVTLTGKMHNLTPGHLLPHNEKYYQQCIAYIESTTPSEKKISKEEVTRLVLLHIRETQLDGLRAEQRLGSDAAYFVESLVKERQKLFLRNLLKDKFQFPLYAFSLYLISYAFFTFLLAAWHEYTLAESFVIPIPFSIIGLILGVGCVTAAFLTLFYRRQKDRLLCKPSQSPYHREELLNYLGIGLSFLIPYILLRLRVTLFHGDLWLVFVIGVAGVWLARYRFIATNTLPV